MKKSTTPRISVLITTFNRENLLRRAIASVLSQSFRDFELLIIDDASFDNTGKVVEAFKDERICYIRNSENIGSTAGDRPHLRRAIYDLARGDYFIYLCDDDYWIDRNLLSKHIKAFNLYPSLSVAIGGQASLYDFDASLFNESFEALSSDEEKIYYDYSVLPSGFRDKNIFLHEFSTHPTRLNLIAGGMLIRKSALQNSGVFRERDGSKWQAGYEITIGIALQGDLFFVNEPVIVTQIEKDNASFRGTQRDHYYDCVKSVNYAFSNYSRNSPHVDKFLLKFKPKFLASITEDFLKNDISYVLGGFADHPLGIDLMFEKRVRLWDVLIAQISSGTKVEGWQLNVFWAYFLNVFVPKKSERKRVRLGKLLVLKQK